MFLIIGLAMCAVLAWMEFSIKRRSLRIFLVAIVCMGGVLFLSKFSVTVGEGMVRNSMARNASYLTAEIARTKSAGDIGALSAQVDLLCSQLPNACLDDRKMIELIEKLTKAGRSTTPLGS